MVLAGRFANGFTAFLIALVLSVAACFAVCPEKAYAADRTLPYGSNVVSSVGTQVSTGHTSCCPAFCCAYGDTILTNTYENHALACELRGMHELQLLRLVEEDRESKRSG